jgi:hypothetical protein
MIFQEYETVVGVSGRKYVVVEDGFVVSRHHSFRDNRKSLADRRNMTLLCEWCFNPFSTKKYAAKKHGKTYMAKSRKKYCSRKCMNSRRWDSYEWNEHIEKLREYGPKCNPKILENPPSKVGL